MTLDDESLLTAYLDGELEPHQRTSIESALLDDPELAERLRLLVAVHELVAGLPRPAPPGDLSGAVVARIGTRPVLPSPRLWEWLRRRPWRVAVPASAVLALAASVLIVVGWSRRSPRSYRPHSPLISRAAVPAGVSTEGRAGPDFNAEMVSTNPPASSSTSSGELASATQLAERSSGEQRTGRPRDREAENRIRAMLESPRLHRVLFVTDTIGGGTPDRVERLVQQTPRTEATYGRITVSQGIVIDPAHPKEAIVFALVMNEQERKHFTKRLEQAFPEHVEDVEADPLVVAQLSDVGQLAVLPGTRASEVIIPGDVSPHIALKANPDGHQAALETSQVAPTFGLPDLATAAHVGQRGRGADARSRPAPEPTLGEAGATIDSTAASSSPASASAREELAQSPASAEAGSETGPSTPGQGSLPSVLGDSLRRAVGLHEPPEIVLVWVTSS